MDRRIEMEELAALLDGELDPRRAEELFAAIQADSELRAAFEEQRAVKLLLGGLPEQEAPLHLDTRVLGVLQSRKSQSPLWRRRTIMAAAGGFVAALTLMVTGIQLAGVAQPTFSTIGNRSEDFLQAENEYLFRPASDPGQMMPIWQDEQLPSDENQGLEDFLSFASEAHSYSKLRCEAERINPDLSKAILVLDGKVYILDEESVDAPVGGGQ